LRQRHARFQLTDHLQKPCLPVFKQRRPGHGLKRNPYLCALWKVELRRHHSDDVEALLGKGNRSPDYVWIRTESFPPQLIAQYSRFRAVYEIIAFVKHPAQRSLDTEQIKEPAADFGALYLYRVAVARQHIAGAKYYRRHHRHSL